MKLLILTENSNLYQRVKLIEPLIYGAITILIGRNLSLKFTASASDKNFKYHVVNDFHEYNFPDGKGLISLAKKSSANPSVMQLVDEG
ncbi:hypothetical protein [Serratia marcescens]|uniref:hypothetical protein n=1 Tax=Serratia marcescens TaxID=615 RepID=UPI0030D2DD71